MPRHNSDVAAIFDEIADLLEVQGANVFRIRAYRNAARTIGVQLSDLGALRAQGKPLTELPGIGADLAGKINEILDTGKCAFLERLRTEVPVGASELLKIPGLGPKRVRTLLLELNIQNLEQLREAAAAGRIHELRGFGTKTEQHILKAVESHESQPKRVKIATATQYAETLVEYLSATRGVSQVVVAGSFRRMRDTVGDLDLLVVANNSAAVTKRFVAYDEVNEILASGDTRASVVLNSGMQVDVRIVPQESFGAALVYFTGSKAHNIALRRIAQARGLKINEYGVFRGDECVAGETEQSVYAAIGLPWLAPELREDRGEIEAAQAGRLPQLVELGDLRGDLHAHSKASDGRASIEAMALAARAAGLEYLAITEHSRQLGIARGLDARRLAQQGEEIDHLNAQLDGMTLLKGIEVEILADGRLDLSDAALGRLDLVIGAVHSQFDLPRAKQTERILRAMDHPNFSILAHPSGRLLGERAGYDVDMSRIIRHAKQRGCYLETNAQPQRLDLWDVHCQMAQTEGVLIAVDSDAHSTFDFANLRFGVGQARRGWLSKQDVLNTRSLKQLRGLLRRTMLRAAS
jgi:DNA polymerase (family 10)